MRFVDMIACAAAALVLSGCVYAQPQVMVWARKDGQRITGGDPALEAKGRSDEIQCRATAAQAVGNVAMPTSVSIGGSGFGSAGDFRQMDVQDAIGKTTMEACMDQAGYRLIHLPPGATYTPT